MTKQSTRTKGMRFQDRITKFLTELGYYVHNQKPSAKMIYIRDKKTGLLEKKYVSVRNDLWGCIDIIAIKPDQKTQLIQATLHTGKTEKLKKLLQIPWPDHMEVSVWMGKPDGSITIHTLKDRELVEYARLWRGKFYKKEA